MIYLNTWHGASLNHVGNAVSGRNDFHFEHINYFCFNGEYERDFIIRDFNVRPEALIETGYPRNDELYSATEKTKQELREKLNIPKGKRLSFMLLPGEKVMMEAQALNWLRPLLGINGKKSLEKITSCCSGHIPIPPSL